MKIPWNKLSKYFSGNCTDKERKEIKSWIEADPEHAELVEELQDIWEESYQEEDWDSDEGWKDFEKKLDSTSKSPLRLVESPYQKFPKTGRKQQQNHKWFLGVRAAAAVAVIAVVSLALYLFKDYQPIQDNTALSMQEVVTEKGQRSQFKLNDGTKVWLNGDSRLKISPRFRSETREVYLEGEAFFSVEPDPERPFVIHAGGSLTKVLGTDFNLQAYPSEDVQVVVKEGRVAFGNEKKGYPTAELVKNQMGILAEDERATISRIEQIQQYTAWTEDRLVFRDTPLTKALKRLERWYDIETSIGDSALKDRTITGTFKDESMTEVLEIISLSVGMVYEKDKNEITFLIKP